MDQASLLATKFTDSDYFRDKFVCCRCGCLEQLEVPKKIDNYDYSIDTKLLKLFIPDANGGWQDLKTKLLDAKRYFLPLLFQALLASLDHFSLAQFIDISGWTRPQHEEQLSQLFAATLDRFDDRNLATDKLLGPIQFCLDQLGFDINYHFARFDDHGKLEYSTYPLHLALIRRMPFEVCKYLLDRGADPRLHDDMCDNAFYKALYNTPEVLDLFIPILPTIKLDSPPFWDVCAPGGNCAQPLSTFTWLKQHGFSPNVSFNDMPALHRLFASTCAGGDNCNTQVQILNWLLANGADINITDSKGQTLLHHHCYEPFDRYVPMQVHKIMLEQADWQIVDSYGCRAIDYLLDYHLHLIGSFGGCYIPNFLVLAILKSGLDSIGNNRLRDGIQPGQRLALAKVMLLLKYTKLTTTIMNDHEKHLVDRIRASVGNKVDISNSDLTLVVVDYILYTFSNLLTDDMVKIVNKIFTVDTGMW